MRLRLYQILEEVDSPINGRIQVVRTFEGAKILVGGISQSGWLVRKVWDASLKSLRKEGFEPEEVLILGLGGGSAAELVSYYWPKAGIVGIDKDTLMISLGKKYLHLANIPNVEIVEGDAEDFIRLKKHDKHFNLVLVDLYVGGKVPQQFTKESFIKRIKEIVKPGGVAAFNHLYSQQEREDAQKLGSKLRKTFPAVKEVYPEANVIFLCFKE